MEDKIPQDRATDKWNGLKQAVIAIFIGAAITIIGDLAQLAVEALQRYPVEVAGPVVGMVKYLAKWAQVHNV